MRLLPTAAAAAAAAFLASGAAAQTDDGMRSIPGYQPSELELALEGIDGRMAEYETRAEAIGGDASLTEAERQAALAALWAEYQPDVMAVTAGAAEFGLRMAAIALQSMDIDRLVETSLAAVDMDAAMAEADAIIARQRAEAEAEVAAGMQAEAQAVDVEPSATPE